MTEYWWCWVVEGKDSALRVNVLSPSKVRGSPTLYIRATWASS